MTDSIEFHYEEEWIAVYLNGKLVTVGDAYYAHEWAENQLGVEHVYDNAFMRGQTDYSGVAKTLDELEEYRSDRDGRDQKIAELQQEIERLKSL